MTKRVKHRAQHIVEVSRLRLRSSSRWSGFFGSILERVQPDHNEPFYKFVWSMMWQDEINKD